MPAVRHRTLAAAVETWFSTHQRPLPWRLIYDPYEVWVSEVMLQQTRMEVVLRYYDRFLARFPDIASLARSDEAGVLAAWSGLGYYRRARMLRHGARAVVERFHGALPLAVADLVTIPGIGRYTAGAVASIANDWPAPIVDGNVARVLSRLLGIEEPVGSAPLMRVAWAAATELITAVTSPRMFNQGLMELGALVCTPRHPSCPVCPLLQHCVAANSGRVEELPHRKEKKATRALTIALYLIEDKRGRILMRRERGDLMTSMFHLPHGDESLFAAEPLDVNATKLVGSFRHTVTNRRIEFRLLRAELNATLRESVEEYAWINPAELETVPHPSYVDKAIAISAVKSPPCAGG